MAPAPPERGAGAVACVMPLGAELRPAAAQEACDQRHGEERRRARLGHRRADLEVVGPRAALPDRQARADADGAVREVRVDPASEGVEVDDANTRLVDEELDLLVDAVEADGVVVPLAATGNAGVELRDLALNRRVGRTVIKRSVARAVAAEEDRQGIALEDRAGVGAAGDVDAVADG